MRVWRSRRCQWLTGIPCVGGSNHHRGRNSGLRLLGRGWRLWLCGGKPSNTPCDIYTWCFLSKLWRWNVVGDVGNVICLLKYLYSGGWQIRLFFFDLSMGEECAPSWWTFFRGWTSDDGLSEAFKKTCRSKNGWSLTTQMMESIWPWWPAWHTATSRLQQESFKCLWIDPSFQYQENGVYWFFLPGSSRWFCTTLCYSFAMRLLILACGSSMWTEWPPAFCGPGCAWSDAHYLHIH